MSKSLRYSPNNRTTVPVLERNGHPLAPARPSRVRKWLELGRATKVWIKGNFAVQLHDLDTANTTVGEFALNVNTGRWELHLNQLATKQTEEAKGSKSPKA